MDLNNKIIDVADLESLSPFFRGTFGRKCAEWFIHISAFDKVNWLYGHSINYTGADFAAGCLKDLGVNYSIGNAERLKMLPEGAFITVSNHPYGGLDGIILIDMIAGIRPDYRLMVNKMISRMKTVKSNIISVSPVDDNNNRDTGTNARAIRETLTHLHTGHPAGFFPSGAVSDFSLKELRIRDREWQESILRIIRSVKVPIVPIRFFDINSPFFYFLGIINWKIRLLRMPSELFNKRNQEPRIAIGSIITVKEQEKFTDYRSLGAFLRKAVYEMPEPATYTLRSLLNLPQKTP